MNQTSKVLLDADSDVIIEENSVSTCLTFKMTNQLHYLKGMTYHLMMTNDLVRDWQYYFIMAKTIFSICLYVIECVK